LEKKKEEQRSCVVDVYGVATDVVLEESSSVLGEVALV